MEGKEQSYKINKRKKDVSQELRQYTMTSQESHQINNLRVTFIQVSTVYAIASDEDSDICKEGK